LDDKSNPFDSEMHRMRFFWKNIPWNCLDNTNVIHHLLCPSPTISTDSYHESDWY